MSFTQKTDKLDMIYESMITEASQKQSLSKVMNALRSAKTKGQLDTAFNMAMNFKKMYGNEHTLWQDLVKFITVDWESDVDKSLMKIIQQKEKELGI